MSLNYLQLIELSHQQAHNAEHNFEDTVFLSITRRDCWVFCLGALLIEGAYPCLEEQTSGILERLAEVLDVQKHHWREKPDAAPET